MDRPTAIRFGTEQHAHDRVTSQPPRRPATAHRYPNMAMKSQTQKSLLFAFITSIVLCGLVGIYCILLGDMGALEGRILGSTAVIGAASILALASAIPWERRRWHPLGPVGMGIVGLTLIQTLGIIWIGDYADFEFLIKALLISITLAVGIPHIGLLSLARLKRGYEWARIGTIACIILLVVVIDLLILTEGFGAGGVVQLIGTLAILDVCGTVAVPILHRVSAVARHDSIQSAALEVTMTCPRCADSRARPIGRSKCVACGLGINLEIEEEHCTKCGYVLFGVVSSACPECGNPITNRVPGIPVAQPHSSSINS